MKNNQKFHNPIFFRLMFIFVCGFLFTHIGTTHVYAEGEEDSGVPENSGGFIIESEKVEGAMDMLGALEGNIHIKEGVIHGLTITKTLDRGEEQEALIIKITSPGPIPVRDLKTSTINGGPPKFGGLCTSSNIDWVCLKNVKMKVPKQVVDKISLPNTTIETCFKSECDNIPEDTSASKKEMQGMMKKMEEQQLTLNEMAKGLKEDKEKLQTIKELLKKINKSYEELEKDGHSEKLEQSLKMITQFLEGEITKEEVVQFIEDNLDSKNKSEEAKQDEDTNKSDSVTENPIVSMSDEIGKAYSSYDKITSEFLNTLEKAIPLVKELEEGIQQKEDSLAAIKKENEKQASDVQQQEESVAALKEKAESESSKQDKETENESKSDGQSEKQNGNEIDLEDLKKDFDQFKKELKGIRESIDKLKEKEKSINKQMDTIANNITEIKAMIEESKVDYSKDVYEKIMGHLPVIQTGGDSEEGNAESDENKEVDDKKETSDEGTENKKEQEDKSKSDETTNDDSTNKDQDQPTNKEETDREGTSEKEGAPKEDKSGVKDKEQPSYKETNTEEGMQEKDKDNSEEDSKVKELIDQTLTGDLLFSITRWHRNGTVP